MPLTRHFLPVGTQAPDFTLADQSGKQQSLSDYQGKWVLLYFYPEDDTPGCTEEACTLRDAWSLFADVNAVVLGVSPDTADSHRSFAAKFQLPFPILADPEKKMINRYGAWGKKNMYGKITEGIIRMSYLIDSEGKIAKVYKRAIPATHAARVLQDLAVMQKQA
jgi:peroxiredoxin Q/BCP